MVDMNEFFATGDCFIKALETAVSLGVLTGEPGVPSNVRICHGLPIGRGPENGGKRYWHAWAEINGIVYDNSNGLRIRVPTGVYYKKGHLREENIFRYEVKDALPLMQEHGHPGPWVDGWREMEDA